MGCSHSQFDSLCDSCLLQYDQAQSAKWAAEEAHLQRLAAEDYQRRMERGARPQPNPQRPKASSGGFPDLSNRAVMWILLLGGVIVLGSSAVAFVASIASVVAGLVKFTLIVGLIAAVGFFLIKKRGDPSSGM